MLSCTCCAGMPLRRSGTRGAGTPGMQWASPGWLFSPPRCVEQEHIQTQPAAVVIASVLSGSLRGAVDRRLAAAVTASKPFGAGAAAAPGEPGGPGAGAAAAARLGRAAGHPGGAAVGAGVSLRSDAATRPLMWDDLSHVCLQLRTAAQGTHEAGAAKGMAWKGQ